ncbi:MULTISPECIES: hypothetical protein [Nocardia]|nr:MULTISPECIES: hypothetical protein [Nocardia]
MLSELLSHLLSLFTWPEWAVLAVAISGLGLLTTWAVRFTRRR